MPRRGPLVASVMLLLLAAALVVGVIIASNGRVADALKSHGTRLAFAVGIGVLLAFVAGYGLRDALGTRAQRAARRPQSPGGKAA